MELNSKFYLAPVIYVSFYAPVAKLEKAALSKGVTMFPGSNPGRGTICRCGLMVKRNLAKV